MGISVETIIEKLGGSQNAARLTGVGTEAVRKWRQARTIPPKHWTAVIRATGLALGDLQSASMQPEDAVKAGDAHRTEDAAKPDPAATETAPPGATALLMLADGSLLWGRGFGAHTQDARPGIGEICFSTAMTGYQETITDPSFAGQIITFTFPHIGNVGVNADDEEAINIAARGVVVKQDLTSPSNWRAAQTLDAWLKLRGIPGICDIDTRALTLRIRDLGPQTAILAYPANGAFDIAALRAEAHAWPGLEGMDLAREVSCTQSYDWTDGVWNWGGAEISPSARKRVVAVDYGAKRNILRCLVTAGCSVTVVPATATAEEILSHNPDGIFLSNGPGDPQATAVYAVPAIRGVLEAGKPLFGICLGHQLLALALGASTYKLDQGHRGANQPVKDLATGRVEITSQNHGFAVDDKSLPDGVRITHVSLFDGSNEGIASDRFPAFSVQYHPEASPGPSDSFHLFERFVTLMR